MGMFEDQKNIWGNLIKGFSNNPNNRQLASTLKEGARQVAGLTVADIPLSAKEAYDYAQNGEYVNSGLSAAAMIPGVPAMAGVIGKANKSGVSKAALKQAEALEQLGETPKNIFERLGVYRGPVDNEWRKHIPDDTAKLNLTELDKNIYNPDILKVNMGGTTLGGLLQHEDAYKSFPFLRDIPVKHDTFGFKGGAYDPEKNVMYLGANPDQTELLSTLLHETQHAIQTKHGLTQGGNPLQFVADANLYKSAETAVSITAQKLTKELVEKFPGTNIYSSKLPEEVVNSPEYVKWKEIQDIQKKYIDFSSELYDKYKHIGGEAEARAVSEQYLNSLLKEFVGPIGKYKPTYRDSTNPLDFYDVDISKTTPAGFRPSAPAQRAPDLATVPKIQGFHGSKTPLSGDVSLNFSGKTSGIPEERAFWLAPTKDEALKFADMAGGNHVTSFDINNSRVKQIPVSIQDITKNTLNKAEEIGKAKQEGFDVLHFVYPKSKYISLEDEFAVINPQVLQKTGEGYNKQFDNLHYTDPFPDTTR